MKLHELKPAEGSRQERKRKGRGIGSGNGKTAGKDTQLLFTMVVNMCLYTLLKTW